MGLPREVVEISSDEDDDERSGKLSVSPGPLGWVAKLGASAAPVPRKKKGRSCGVRVGKDDDCVILDGDPHRPAAVAGVKGRTAGDGASDEVEIVAVKGEIACKDFPHSRHICSELPFNTTSHVKYCSMIIYDTETGLSCGYGYVTMSTVQEAENAVKNYHLRELYGRLVTVSKAAASASPSGAGAEETPAPCPSVSCSFKLYVANLPWEVDGSKLKQLFSEYGQVVNAKVLYNEEELGGAPGDTVSSQWRRRRDLRTPFGTSTNRFGGDVNYKCDLQERKGHGDAFMCCKGN